jgi:ABC-type transporter lipoprotein component MlaA
LSIISNKYGQYLEINTVFGLMGKLDIACFVKKVYVDLRGLKRPASKVGISV